jgi:hypothetical protein
MGNDFFFSVYLALGYFGEIGAFGELGRWERQENIFFFPFMNAIKHFFKLFKSL